MPAAAPAPFFKISSEVIAHDEERNLMWVSTLTILQLAEVCSVRLSQARRWVRAGVIQPIRREGKAYVYGRDDTVVGAVLKLLQQTLGEKSPLPLSLAADLRPRLVGWLRWNERPRHGGAIQIPINRDDVTVTVEVGAGELDAICDRLDALGGDERRAEGGSAPGAARMTTAMLLPDDNYATHDLPST